MLYAERHRPRGVGLAGAVHRTWAVTEKNDWQFSNPRIDTDWSRDTFEWTCPSCQLSHSYNTLSTSSISTDERPEIPPRPRFNTNRRQHKPKYKLKVCVINVNGLKGLDKRAAFHA